MSLNTHRPERSYLRPRRNSPRSDSPSFPSCPESILTVTSWNFLEQVLSEREKAKRDEDILRDQVRVEREALEWQVTKLKRELKWKENIKDTEDEKVTAKQAKVPVLSLGQNGGQLMYGGNPLYIRTPRDVFLDTDSESPSATPRR